MDVTQFDLALSAIDTFLWPEEDPKPRRKRERILHAAVDLFVRFGYRKTSIDEVAKQAGVAKGTVYLYYSNKAELVYHALCLEERAFLIGMLPLAEANLTPHDRLHSFITQSVKMTREVPLMAALIQGDHEFEIALKELDKEVFANVNAIQGGYVQRLLKEATGGAVSDADLKTRGQVLIDVLYALTTSPLMNTQGVDWETYIGSVADLLVDGVLAPGKQGDSKRGKPQRDTRQKSKRPQAVR